MCNEIVSNKIVKRPVKVDFHIHSYYSITKDNNEIVGNGTIENLSTLLSKLNEYGVNMASITDHDCFSYEMYKAFKSHEGEGTLLKVLPGIEFSLSIPDENLKPKSIHIIAIFDDKDDRKISKIDSNIPKDKNGKILYDEQSISSFTEAKLIDILRKIDLNVVLIAHQKNSISSQSKKKNDLNTIGNELFNDFLTSEVFEALEFKSLKNGLFNNIFAKKKNKELNYDIVKFITGSDCHQWECYPKHDNKETDEEVSSFRHTYLKCLPTFKGLTMALSDYSRIHLGDSFFSIDDKKLKEINIEINGNKISIPLSDGINAIIGDNSIGKSLLLHKLTNYKESVLDDKTKKGYNEYLNKNNIIIQSNIDESKLYYFDFQGSIRKRFESKSGSRNQEFLNCKFPDSPSSECYIQKIQQEFEKLYKSIELKFAFDDEYDNLKTLLMTNKDIKSKMIVCNKIENNQKAMSGYSAVCKYINGIISKINERKNNAYLENDDATNIIKIKNYLTKLLTKYQNKYIDEKQIYDIKNSLNNGITNYNEYVKAYKNEETNVKEQFETDSNDVAISLAKLVDLKKKIKKFVFEIDKPEETVPNSLHYNGYTFVKRFKNVKQINNEYLLEILNSCLKANKTINTQTITKKELENILKDFDSTKEDVVDSLKEKVNARINSDFKIETVILKKGIDQYASLSNGLNATIYFDIISGDDKQGIYIVDQPEDDVSQKSIKENLISDFKKMSEKRQIVLVTHNPQFVVNLDVDNVICIYKNKNEIAISSGALEFEDENNNIIQIVADNLDGGVDAIKKRWKRYGKDTGTN